LFSLANDIVGTFMGAFNGYEIQQLKSKFNNLHSGHNMLVRVTTQHDKDIKNLSDNMKSIMDVIDLMTSNALVEVKQKHLHNVVQNFVS
jgi:phosphopantetheine adenylyltransferase